MEVCFSRTVGALLLFINIMAIVATALLLLVLYHFWKFYRPHPIYISIVSLSVSCLMYTFGDLVVAVPCLLTSCSHISSDFLMDILSATNSIGYYTYQFTLLAISFDRVCVFYDNGRARLSKKFTIIVLIFIWIGVLSFLTMATFLGCRKFFDTDIQAFRFTRDPTWKAVFLWMGQIPIFLMIVSSIWVAICVKRLGREMRTKNSTREISLFVQLVVVCSFSWLSSACFLILPGFFEWGNLTVSSVKTLLSAISISSNSFVMCTFNNQIKKHILLLPSECSSACKTFLGGTKTAITRVCTIKGSFT
ncbi:hypothetical protein Y032_0455g1758 [Ancylostoma ceylanicum]|uniref:G-protein coupled receptors family 1 profile domain-containing protein n=4 Tax=Ancylostoma ceylanicum TaxID=53326 RepID=A0A016WYA3_9BILA|nr:hypothetical protein Y032_0455g1758 [Ancylostoma ceylanicum]